MNILVCGVLIGSVIGYPANNLSSNVRPKDKDTSWMVLFTEFCFNAAVLIQFTLPKNMLSQEMCHFHVVLPAMHFDEICEINTEIMTYILTYESPDYQIESIVHEKLDISCKIHSVNCMVTDKGAKYIIKSTGTTAHSPQGLTIKSKHILTNCRSQNRTATIRPQQDMWPRH